MQAPMIGVKKMYKGSIMKRTVTANFRQHCLEKYPTLANDLRYLRFFNYLCFSSFYDKDDQKLLLNAKTIAEICKEVESYNSRHFSAISFLKEFKENVIPSFEWTKEEPYIDGKWAGKARMVANNGIDPETWEMVQREIKCFSGAPTEDLVFFETGEKYYQHTRRAAIVSTADQYQQAKQTYELNDAQTRIQSYMEKVNPEVFSKKINANKDGIIAAVEAIPELHKRLIQYRILDSIKEDPAVYYRPSERGRTARLFHSSDCVVALKKTVRQAFCKGWSEMDLVSSQFAILAEILNAPLAKAFLGSGHDLWDYLNAEIFSDALTGLKKRMLKTVIYGLAFGRTKREIKIEIEGMGGDVDLLFRNPIINELFTRRREWLNAIKKHGYVTDAWGNRIEVTTDRWEGACAAAKIQSIELEIISHVFPVAERYASDCQITIFQHDGFCISFSDKIRKNKVIKEMNEAISVAAAKYNVITRLDCVDL